MALSFNPNDLTSVAKTNRFKFGREIADTKNIDAKTLISMHDSMERLIANKQSIDNDSGQVKLAMGIKSHLNIVSMEIARRDVDVPKKSINKLAKTIAKVKTSPPITTKPVETQASVTGTKFKSPQGQGSLFRDTSRYKYAKASISSNTSTAVPENQLGFDFNTKTKAKPKVKQLTEAETDKLVAKFHKDGEMFANNDVLIAKVVKATAKVSKVAKEAKVARGPRERTPHEIAREARLKQKADTEYLKAQTASRKVSIDKNTEYAKMRHHKKHDDTMLMRQELTEKARDKIDKRKFNKHKLTLANKESLMNTHIKLKEMDMHKLEIKHRHDIEKGEARQRIQLERNKQSNRAKMESHLHKIHPALGALYGMHQNSKDEREASGGLGASALAGGVGGVGGMLGKTAMSKMGGMLGKVGGLSGLLKSAIKTAPFIAAVGGGVIEGIESRDAKKGLATASAGIIGAYLGGAIGTLFVPGAGTVVGAGVGAWLGNLAGKGLYNSAHGLSDKQDEGLRDAIGKSSAPKSSVSNSVIKSSKPQVMGGGDFAKRKTRKESSAGVPTDAESAFLSEISAYEGASYDTKYGGGKVDFSNMTLNDVAAYQKNNNNWAKNKKGDVVSRAVGKYQFTTDTLKEVVAASGLDPATTKFTPDIQDKLFMQRLKSSRGYDDFRAGKINKKQFALNLSKELASLPNPNTGKSYYDGDSAGNRSHISSQSLYGTLDRLQQAKGPSMVAGLQQADNNYQKTSASVKSQPVSVVMQGGNSSGGTSVVNNTTVHAPVVDATIRQLQYATQQHARIV